MITAPSVRISSVARDVSEGGVGYPLCDKRLRRSHYQLQKHAIGILTSRRGQYVERYGALAPWRGRWDVKILQDIMVSQDNKLQLSLDILNFGNLISSDWGLVQQARNLQPVGISVDPATLEPTYTFDPNLTETLP